MNETKESAGIYLIPRLSTEAIVLPPEFAWLHWLTLDEQRAFFQALVNALAQAWGSLNIAPLSQEIERWQEYAEECRVARSEAERRVLWASHEQRLNQQRALIDELLEETIDGADVPSTLEIRDLLEQHIPYDASLSDDIITTRYEEQ